MIRRLVICILLSAGVLLIPATLQQIGPTPRLRIAVWDYSQSTWLYLTTVELWPRLLEGHDLPVLLEVAATLPNATVGVAYSQSLIASGGTAPYTWAVTSGTLPIGLSLSSSGVLSGTATAVGQFLITVTVTDANLVSRTLTFTSSPMGSI